MPMRSARRRLPMEDQREAGVTVAHKLSNLAGSTTTTTSRSRGTPNSPTRMMSPPASSAMAERPSRERCQRPRSAHRAFETFKATEDRPTLIIVDSHIGWDRPTSRTPVAHGEALGVEIKLTKEFETWPRRNRSSSPMACRPVQERPVRGKKARGLVRPLRGLPEAHPELAEELYQMQHRTFPMAGTRTRTVPRRRGWPGVEWPVLNAVAERAG